MQRVGNVVVADLPAVEKLVPDLGRADERTGFPAGHVGKCAALQRLVEIGVAGAQTGSGVDGRGDGPRPGVPIR